MVDNVKKKRVVRKKVGKKAVKPKNDRVEEVEAESEVEVPEVPDMGNVGSGSEEGVDEESYSSDDEVGQLTRTGDVPLAWYNDEDHAGYDVEGQKIVKETKDALSKLISKFDDPSEMMTVYEKLTGKGHKLTPGDIQILLNLQKNKYPDPSYNPYPEGLDFVQWDQNPFDKGCPPKSRFTPSKHELKTIAKLVRKMRRLERNPPPPKEESAEEFLLWNDGEELSDAILKRQKFRIGPPKKELPATNESYNPPLEYLKTEDEIKDIKAENPIDQPDFIPQKYDSLRQVPWYRNTLRERYQRCLDLFTFTRKKKEKVDIKPESLLPDLPKPEELRPYPQRLGFVYKGHTGPVRQLSVSANGQYLATACDDHFARVFEVCTGRLVVKWNMKAPVSCVAWNPNPAYNILAISADKLLVFAVPKSCATTAVNELSVETILKGNSTTPTTDAINLVSSMIADGDSDAEEIQHNLDSDIEEDDAPERDLVEWLDAPEKEQKQGVITKAVHHFRIKHFAWHHKGDYIGSICPKDKKSRQVIVLQLSVRSSISPFKRFKENVQALSFHPTQPYLLIATRRSVRMYNLVQSQLIKKFKGTVDSVASVDVHAGGDNILVGSHDGPVMWYDVDYSDKPYKKLTSHKTAVHTARYHPTPHVYPLFASAGDNGQIHVFHGRVYDDYTKNAFLVPLKIIKGHKVAGSVGILHIAFHPTLPWLFSAGGDGGVKCWTE
eukprot:TRINITY_DN7637_c0_g2_i1.p1 TRINITY_DN7637_c0_g2~~TRINITY_DN7637_c0_g2_i1.p1  ORF type:complete len:733 (+),score=195.47 TRINITY_DN7637_c0_g2_i1:37-2199(+)